jgi:hypothetical protein
MRLQGYSEMVRFTRLALLLAAIAISAAQAVAYDAPGQRTPAVSVQPLGAPQPVPTEPNDPAAATDGGGKYTPQATAMLLNY